MNVREINAELRNNRGVTHHLLSLCGARINQEEAQRLVENVVNLDRQHAVAAEYVTERLNTRKRRISVSIILSYCSLVFTMFYKTLDDIEYNKILTDFLN